MAKNNQLEDQAQDSQTQNWLFFCISKESIRETGVPQPQPSLNTMMMPLREKGFSRKSRFVPGACHLLTIFTNRCAGIPWRKQNSLHPPEGMCTDKETTQTQVMREVSSEKIHYYYLHFASFSSPSSSDADNCQISVPSVDQEISLRRYSY